MTKLNKIINADKKTDVNMFFKNLVGGAIGNPDCDNNVPLNDLITRYVVDSALGVADGCPEDLTNTDIAVAVLLAFLERISTSESKPSSIDEILNTDGYTIKDMIAECTGIIAESMFNGYHERADRYLAYLVAFVKMLLKDEGYEYANDCSESDESAASEQGINANEEAGSDECVHPV